MDEHEIIRASRNIPVIIGYLRRHFQGFVIRVEEQPPSRVIFSLTDLSSGERLTLGCFGRRWAIETTHLILFNKK
jgi:hypothetical protein